LSLRKAARDAKGAFTKKFAGFWLSFRDLLEENSEENSENIGLR